MTQRIWNSISFGGYFDPSSWNGGTVPTAGDSVVIDGRRGQTPYRVVPPYGVGSYLSSYVGPDFGTTRNLSPVDDVVQLFSSSLYYAISLQPDPSTLPAAAAVASVTITAAGGSDLVEFDLTKSTLASSTTAQLSGNVEFQAEYDNTLAGQILMLPTAGGPLNDLGYNGELDIVVLPYGSINPTTQLSRNYTPTTTNSGLIAAGAGSRVEIDLEGMTPAAYRFLSTPYELGGYAAFVNNGTIAVADGSLDVEGGFQEGYGSFNTFTNNGAIQIQGVNIGAFGRFDTEVDGLGSIAIAGTATAVASAAFLGGMNNAVTLADGTASFNGSGRSFKYAYNGSFTFEDGRGTLVIDELEPTGPFLPIHGLQAGDQIVVGSAEFDTLGGFAPPTPTVTWDQAHGALTIGYAFSATGFGSTVRTLNLIGAYQQSQFSVTAYGGNGLVYGQPGFIEPSATITVVACYCRGTSIQTDAGEIVVEELAVGDRLVTVGSTLRPVRWIGRRSYMARCAAGNRDVWPILIQAGALDDVLPRRDLMVSPAHAMFLHGVLISAEALVNGTSVVRKAPTGPVEYFHVELDEHDVIFAEGSPSESYIEDGNREMFHNAASGWGGVGSATGAAAVYCAPWIDNGHLLEAVPRQLATCIPGQAQAAA